MSNITKIPVARIIFRKVYCYKKIKNVVEKIDCVYQFGI